MIWCLPKAPTPPSPIQQPRRAQKGNWQQPAAEQGVRGGKPAPPRAARHAADLGAKRRGRARLAAGFRPPVPAPTMSLGYADRLSFREDLGGRLGAPELFDDAAAVVDGAARLAQIVRWCKGQGSGAAAAQRQRQRHSGSGNIAAAAGTSQRQRHSGSVAAQSSFLSHYQCPLLEPQVGAAHRVTAFAGTGISTACMHASIHCHNIPLPPKIGRRRAPRRRIHRRWHQHRVRHPRLPGPLWRVDAAARGAAAAAAADELRVRQAQPNTHGAPPAAAGVNSIITGSTFTACLRLFAAACALYAADSRK